MSNKPQICLAMIVKDEAHIINRCLDAARPLIDSFFIIDTGSTDGTMEIIDEFMDAFDIPGTIAEEEWVDFGLNRSSLVAQARKQGADYLLLLDADMVVKAEEGALDELGGDGYFVRQFQGGFDWWMPYLVRCDLAWKFVGRTHEFLACDDNYELSRLYGLSLEHHADSGTRGEKSDRDLALLEKDLADDPENVRHMFYLAQTYGDMGRADDALAMYQRRIDAGGWDEEIYISYLRMAQLKNDVGMYLKAWEFRPSRAEALYHAIESLNSAGAYRASYTIGGHALDDLKTGDQLFVDVWIEQYGLEFVLAVAAWWCGHIDEAKEIFTHLLEVPEMPENYRESTLRNLELCP